MKIMKQMKTWALTAFLIFCSAGTAWAQSAINDIPAEVNAADATITNMGHATMTMKRVVVTDPTTQNADTLMKVENIEWNTEVDTAKKRMARRKAIAGSDFYEKDSNWYLDLWWFNYLYPSINADGEEITLSSMACMPDEDCDYVNNIIVGCHVTITSNKECPTSYSKEGSFRSDVSMLMNYAGSGTGFAIIFGSGVTVPVIGSAFLSGPFAICMNVQPEREIKMLITSRMRIPFLCLISPSPQ